MTKIFVNLVQRLLAYQSYEILGLYTYVRSIRIAIPCGIRTPVHVRISSVRMRMTRPVTIGQKAGAAITIRIFWGQAGTGEAGLGMAGLGVAGLGVAGMGMAGLGLA